MKKEIIGYVTVTYPKNIIKFLKGKFQFQRLICIYITRDIATRIIQRNCRNWIDKPITSNGRLGIALRIGLRQCCNYDSLYS